MTAIDIINRINNGEQSIKNIRQMLFTVPKSEVKRPTAYKCGDIFYHTGFEHPMIAIKKVRGTDKETPNWLFVMLSTKGEKSHCIEKVQSRFEVGYFTRSITVDNPNNFGFLGVCENKAQVKRIYEALKNNLV